MEEFPYIQRSVRVPVQLCGACFDLCISHGTVQSSVPEVAFENLATMGIPWAFALTYVGRYCDNFRQQSIVIAAIGWQLIYTRRYDSTQYKLQVHMIYRRQ